MATKPEQLAALEGHDNVFAVTSVRDITADSKFTHSENVILYRIEFYEVQGESVVPRHCNMIVVDEGEGTEDARWFGGEPVGEWYGKSLASRVISSALFKSKHGKILQVRDDCLIVSAIVDGEDPDSPDEEIVVRVWEEDGKIKLKPVNVTLGLEPQ